MKINDARTTVSEREGPWRAELGSISGDQQTQWIEYGLHMQLLAELPDEEFDAMISSGELNPERLKVVFRLPELKKWEQDEHRFSAILDSILNGDVVATGQSRVPGYIPHLFAHCQSVWRFGVALRDRGPVPEDWATDLTVWDTMVEKSRMLFGEHWAQVRIACLASGIQSTSEQCNNCPDLFDVSKSLCRRARYARLRAGHRPLRSGGQNSQGQFGPPRSRTGEPVRTGSASAGLWPVNIHREEHYSLL